MRMGDMQETAISISFHSNLLHLHNAYPQHSLQQHTHSAHTDATIHAFHVLCALRGNQCSHFLFIYLSFCSTFLVNSTLSLCQKCVVIICCLLLPHQKADAVCAITCNTHKRWNQLERRHGDSAVLRLLHHPVPPLQNLLHSLYRNFSFTLIFFFLY